MYSEAVTRLLEKMQRGERPIGLLVGSIDPAITDILGAVGFDFVIIDNEAAPTDPQVALQHVRAAETHGMVPMVKVLENSPTLIRAFLNVGCQGIVVPHVETAEQAARAVQATRFHPGGTRGMCPGCHAANYAFAGAPSWHKWREHSDVIVSPIIESQSGMKNLRGILSVDGIDIVNFGAGDLLQDLGEPHSDGSALQNSWRRLLSDAKELGKFVMGFPYPAPTMEATRKLFADGADAVVHYMDLMLFHELALSIMDARQ
jgi:2-keto-3-deoxy-L-rhamnonate aldolase RhmA